MPRTIYLPTEVRFRYAPTQPVEGWTDLVNTTKWHYFRSGRSLCGRWGLLDTIDLTQGADKSPDNCAECRRRRLRELGAALAGEES